MKVRYSPRARADIEAISGFLQQRSPSGATRVLQSIYSAVRLVAEHPEAAQQTDNPEVRAIVARQYPYRVFYTVSDDTIFVLHVRHTSRQHRMEE